MRTARILTIAGWVVVVPLTMVALMRMVAWDELEPYVLVNSITVPVYMPAWLVALFALASRRRALALTSTAVVAAHVGFLARELAARRAIPQWARTAPSFRLFNANVFWHNRDVSQYAAAIAQERPDLVTLEEANPWMYDELERAGAFAELPHRFVVDRHDAWAFVIASRYPLRDVRVVPMPVRPHMVQATVDLPSGSLTLWVVHAASPVRALRPDWTSQLSEIAALVRAERSPRLLIVGDFNATWGTKGFREILEAGVTDGAAARGRALAMTWSQKKAPLPPVIRIDHVLTGPDVEVTAITTGNGPGSDHRYLSATIAVRGDPVPEARHGRGSLAVRRSWTRFAPG